MQKNKLIALILLVVAVSMGTVAVLGTHLINPQSKPTLPPPTPQPTYTYTFHLVHQYVKPTTTGEIVDSRDISVTTHGLDIRSESVGNSTIAITFGWYYSSTWRDVSNATFSVSPYVFQPGQLYTLILVADTNTQYTFTIST